MYRRAWDKTTPPTEAGGGVKDAFRISLSCVMAYRELAQQIEREVRDFTRTSSKEVRSTIVVGGTNMGEQRGDLRSGVEIVVATPGRFIDHLQQVGIQPCPECASFCFELH